jgi:hypothetical protein
MRHQDFFTPLGSLRGPGTAIADAAAQPRDQLLDHLFVGRAEPVFLGRRRVGLFSMSRIMSISILVARNSAEADLLTS